MKSSCRPSVRAAAHPGPRTADDYNGGIETAVTAFSQCYLIPPPVATVTSYLSIYCLQASI